MRWKSYLRYLLRRQGAFRIHSPFVYQLYTQVIQGGDDEALKSLGIESTVTVAEALPCKGDPSVMYVVKGVHENKEKEAFWDTICGCPDVTLTIDLYRKGLFFYREGMEKQNFVLRS